MGTGVIEVFGMGTEASEQFGVRTGITDTSGTGIEE